MTRLSELLGEAVGPVEPTFGVDDIEQRVKRRRRTRARTAIAAVVTVAVAIGVTVTIVADGATPAPRVRIQPSGPTTPTTTALPPPGASTASLRATAVAWAHAFLVGSPDDIRALEGPECTDRSGTTIGARIVTQYLRAMRATMQQSFGRPLDKIKITAVVLRNVTAKTGEALVEYDLPAAVTGNDNWVAYAIHDGRWKVSDCRAPIGGSSSGKSG